MMLQELRSKLTLNGSKGYLGRGQEGWLRGRSLLKGIRRSGCCAQRGVAILLVGVMGSLGGWLVRAQSVDAAVEGVRDGAMFRAAQDTVGVAFAWTLPSVVVTASGTQQGLKDVAVPVEVLGTAQLQAGVYATLAEVLAEQPGVELAEDHGAGLQMQGLDAAYVLFLVDGKPLIGREAGTFDVSRLGTQSIARVEIVHGPSSSRYGSEALAGVVNVITRRPTLGWHAFADVGLGTHGSTRSSISVEHGSDRITAHLTASRRTSRGYDLFPETPGATQPAYQVHELRTRTVWDGSKGDVFSLTAGGSYRGEQSLVGFNQQGVVVTYGERAARLEGIFAPSWQRNWTNRIVSDLSYAHNRYRTRLDFEGADLRVGLGNTDFDQRQDHGSLTLTYRGDRHILSSGVGVIHDGVQSDRIASAAPSTAQEDGRSGAMARRSTHTMFAYLQDQWVGSARWEVTSGFRVDVHSAFGTHASPKVAALWRFSDEHRMRLSIGSGFKSPTFQELYMDFGNPVGGYRVIGASDRDVQLASLRDAGRIAYIHASSTGSAMLRPETSWSAQGVYSYDSDGPLSFDVHLYANRVKDLIEYQPVAVLTDGQTLFSYYNVRRVQTAGTSIRMQWRPKAPWHMSASYTWSRAVDLDVLRQIDRGSLYTRLNGRDVRLSRDGYGGLFRRSPHRATAQIWWRPSSDWDASASITYRSRFGYEDVNGNLVLDSDREYVNGYALVTLSARKRLRDWVTIYVRAENLGDYIDPTYVQSLSGRLITVGLRTSWDS